MITYSSYDIEEQEIKIPLDTGGELTVHMTREYLAYYGPGCDIELDFIADAAKDIIFRIEGADYTALQIVQWCINNHDDIRAEAEQEAEDEEAMARELSSPYLTGRI